LDVEFVKCDKDEPGYEDQERICQSKSDINKWLSDKTFFTFVKENWVDYSDFDQPIKS